MIGTENRIEVRGAGLDKSQVRLSDFLLSHLAGGPVGMSVPFLASAAAGTLIARFPNPFAGEGWTSMFVGSWPAGSWPANAGLTVTVPPQLVFVGGGDTMRVERGPAAAAAGTTYNALVLIANSTLIDQVYWKATIPFVAT